MAEVKKKFSQLDPGSVPFTGTEIIAAVQGGITKRGTISGIHGAGWWDQLKAAFVDFIAPDALHANDADTLGGETSADLRNAGALTGTLPLGVIPAELTGKNAATASSAAKLTNARTITVNGDATGSVTFDGSANRTLTLDVTYATSAGSAGYATTAGSAGYATTAGTAGVAVFIAGSFNDIAGRTLSIGSGGLASDFRITKPIMASVEIRNTSTPETSGSLQFDTKGGYGYQTIASRSFSSPNNSISIPVFLGPGDYRLSRTNTGCQVSVRPLSIFGQSTASPSPIT